MNPQDAYNLGMADAAAYTGTGAYADEYGGYYDDAGGYYGADGSYIDSTGAYYDPATTAYLCGTQDLAAAYGSPY